MKELGFSEEEFAFLQEASNNSDALIATETQAMESIGRGEFVSGPFQMNSGENHRQFALRILFDKNYHAEVENIMNPVKRFFTALDERTSADVRKAQESAERWASFAGFVLIAAALATESQRYWL